MESVPVKKRHPAAIILDALLAGEPVVVGGEEWYYQDGVFGIRGEVFQDGVRRDDVILSVDMSVASFVKWCEKLPEETVALAIFSKVIRRERTRRP